MNAGGDHDGLSKMQGVDGERVATGVFAGGRGVSLYQLRIGHRSLDCAESGDPVACEAAGPERGLMVRPNS